MTQRQEKTVICKSVVMATVVAIRDVVKNGFHCIHLRGGIFASSDVLYRTCSKDGASVVSGLSLWT